LGRGVAQMNKRRLLGPQLSPKQEHGLRAFFLRSASTDDIVGVSLFSSSATWGSTAASWFSHTAVAAESAVSTESSSESMFSMVTMKGAAILKNRASAQQAHAEP
jgi:hypothetical protein